MKSNSNIIAVRELHFEGDLDKKIRVEVMQPYLSGDGLYRCEFSIEGAPEELSNLYAAGVDSYQAICMAFSVLSTTIKIFNREYCDSKLRWMGDVDLNFSFSTELSYEGD